MSLSLNEIIKELGKTEHGFKHIITAGNELLNNDKFDHYAVSDKLLDEESYQARMLGTYLLGELSAKNPEALFLLKTKVANDDNWRVQEMLAKAFDRFCERTGYKESLPEIKNWLSDDDPKINRAVIEGLRIWTSRPYFKEHPEIAIDLIRRNRANNSEYLRKSVGNALRDIAKRHHQLVVREIDTWDLADPKVVFTYKLVLNNK